MNPYKRFHHHYYVVRISGDNYFSCAGGLYSSSSPALENEVHFPKHKLQPGGRLPVDSYTAIPHKPSYKPQLYTTYTCSCAGHKCMYGSVWGLPTSIGQTISLSEHTSHAPLHQWAAIALPTGAEFRVPKGSAQGSPSTKPQAQMAATPPGHPTAQERTRCRAPWHRNPRPPARGASIHTLGTAYHAQKCLPHMHSARHRMPSAHRETPAGGIPTRNRCSAPSQRYPC